MGNYSAAFNRSTVESALVAQLQIGNLSVLMGDSSQRVHVKLIPAKPNAGGISVAPQRRTLHDGQMIE
ncbi:MAG: hypothetical protein ACI9BW_003773 [Gammaproteobacteria bacterium]|jgi:hypothetical protein